MGSEVIIEGLKLVHKIIAKLKSLCWKGKDLIYIHATKKTVDINDIDKLIPIRNAHIIDNQPKRVKLGFKWYNAHLKHMKINLYSILKNYDECGEISYVGYVNVPFAIYDGYCLGDNKDYTLFDSTKNENKFYKIDFKKKRNIANKFSVKQSDEVELYIYSSYKIGKHNDNDLPKYEFDLPISDELTLDYLNDMFYKITDFLDECRTNGVLKVHMYCATRQPVSFIIGTAIQSHHPEIIVYDFENSKYTWGLSIKKGKLIREGNLQ